MNVSESRRSDDHGVPGSDLTSLSIGLVEIGARGVRMALGRAIPGERLYDVALGAALVTGGIAAQAVESVRSLVSPRALRLLRPPTFPIPLTWPGARIVENLEQRGRRTRLDDTRTVEAVIDILVPVIAEELLARIDVDALVQEQVDIETIISGVDLDAVVESVDVDKVAARLDLDAVLDRIDLNAIVRDRVDVDAIVRAVDIDAVAARLDLDAVIERLNLPVLAQDVIDEINLPVIIRESSGSMASEAVRGVRLHSIDADDAVHRALERVLHHRRGGAAARASNPDAPAGEVEVAMSMGAAPMGASEPSTRPTR